MPQDTRVLRGYFAKLGFAPEIADLYIALHSFGSQTISDLARNSGVERTRIYRLIDDMAKANLLEIEKHYKRNIYRAAPVSNLQILLSKKEEELHELHRDLDSVQQSLQERAMQSPTTSVQFFQGTEGLKQMYWNQTKAKTENLSILFENSQTRTNKVFFERWARECNCRNLTFRGIVSDSFITSQQVWYAKNDNERLANWQSRYISPDFFKITHSTIIYDNVVTYHSWHNKVIFGIEIHNQEIADAQRVFFEMLWQQAKSLDRAVSQQLEFDK